MTCEYHEDIGSGVYTGKQTHRIRKKYGIPGNYNDDIIKGICCQPCSLIRNENEIRQRESLNHALENRGPVPLGENNYQPMFTMTVSDQNQPLFTLPINEGYRPEPRMGSQGSGQSKSGLGHREVHFHEPSQGDQGSRIAPLCAGDEDLQYANIQLPQIPDVGSPLSIDVLGRRLQALTPISEGESADVSHHIGNTPKVAQVQDWLHSAGQALAGKNTTGKGVMVPGPSNRPALIQTGKAPPEQPPSPKPKKEAPLGKGLKRMDKKKQIGSPESQEVLMVDTPEIVVTPTPEPAGVAKPISNFPGHADLRNGLTRAVNHPLAAHYLTTDILVSSPMMADLDHDIGHDVGVLRPESGPPKQHDLSQNKQVGYIQLTDPEHDLSVDQTIDFINQPNTQRNLSIDKKVDFISLADTEHELARDRRVTVSDPPFREHNLSLDNVVDVSNDDITWIDQGPGERKLSRDTKRDAPKSLTEEHDPQSDIHVRTPGLLEAEEHGLSRDEVAPEPLQPPEHTLSQDKQVATPAPRGAFGHGIHLDERVPVPELVWAALEHEILKDRQVLPPSSGYEEHDLHADERVKSPAILSPYEHDIKSDKQVADPPGPAKQPWLRQGDTFPWASKKLVKDHSVSEVNKEAQRANQLLEHFLKQDKKASRRSRKSC